MSIRNFKKDHLKDLAPELIAVESAAPHIETGDPLKFFTRHETKPYFVDLTSLSSGQTSSKNSRDADWNGPYSGRPTLIQELAPAIRDKLLFAADISVIKHISHLQWWWRLLDELESQSSETGHKIPRLTSVVQLGDLHARTALDRGCSAHQFGSLRNVANTTRQALGLPPLPWKGPESSHTTRTLLPETEIARVWSKLKHGWFDAIDRWKRADAFLAGDLSPESPADTILFENRHHIEMTKRRLEAKGKLAHPSFIELKSGYTKKDVGSGRNAMAAYESVYPTGTDIRYAFHLCLAGTGWNPQTLLDLTVDPNAAGLDRTPFLRNHPSTDSRYILTGFKERSASFQDVDGDWKTDRSPGAVLKRLVEQTWPMRQVLLQELTEANNALKKATSANLHLDKTKPLWEKVKKLKAMTRSVWLFFDTKGIQSLNADSYYLLGSGKKNFLTPIINGLKLTQPKGAPPFRLTASDFRDAFAAYVWRSTGGSVLHVMRALGHRRLSSTTIYLNNTLINQESSKIYLNFCHALWQEIRISGKIDLTLLAKISRDGDYNKSEYSRLIEYRNLKRSRIGISCKDSYNPPPEIDPSFAPDGKKQCHIQRCTLCVKNAVITKESMPGLCMRTAELLFLKSQMPFDSFLLGEYQLELENTQAALLAFDSNDVQSNILLWTQRINSGTHRPIEFNGKIIKNQ